MYLLGLAGYKRSGKDEVCKALQKLLAPKRVIRVGFADALKEEISLAIGQPTEYIERYKNSFRLIMQGWGTDFRRTLCGDDYWINKWMTKVNHLPPDTYLVVVPDCRFTNEADIIRELGGVIWGVKRNQLDSTDNHESEKNIDNIAYKAVIYNDTSLEALAKTVEHAWKNNYGIHTTK